MSTRSLKRPASRRQFVVLTSGSALGCALGCSFQRTNFQDVDLRGFNLQDPDENPLDLATPRDMAGPRDMVPPRDLANPPPDFAGRDLSGVDFARPPDDLTRPPDDLTRPQDLTSPPDMACSGGGGGSIFLAPGAKNLAVNQHLLFNVPNLSRELIVARDAAGFFALWNRCQHSGCVTNFNAGARSWDCPCHGSRHSFDGTVLNGPTAEPLRYRSMYRKDGDPNGDFIVTTDDSCMLPRGTRNYRVK